MSAIQKLDVWASRLLQLYPLSTLKDAVIGVDASYYLDLRLNHFSEEPLKHALGGIPFCLRKSIEEDIQGLKEAGVGLVFVFNGLDFVNKPPSEAQSLDSLRAQQEGWNHYRNGDNRSPVVDFGRAKFPVESMYRYLQKVLAQNDIPYLVAPYSAVAQLSYMVKLPEQYIDAVMSSTEAFLFDVDKLVTNFNVTNSTFEWLGRSACEERLKTSNDVFRDAHLLLGTSYSPLFPVLERMSMGKPVGIAEAVTMLNSAGKSVIQLCNYHRDNPQVQALQYVDRYKKAIMTIRHHVVLETNGIVAPLDFDRAPGDVHEFVGQRLPEELFFYISKGLIGGQVPNWITSGEIDLPLPGGVIDGEPYRRVLVEQLNPIRATALKLVAECLNYYYQSRVIKLKTWDGRDTGNLTINLKEIPPLKMKMSQWKVQSASSGDPSTKTPTFSTCISAFKDQAFAQNSITTKRGEYPALKSVEDIKSNVIWRFLQVRGYVDERHEVTRWGLALAAALDRADESVLEDDIIVGMELLRAGVLNAVPANGVPYSQRDKKIEHKTGTALVSKVACLGRLKHNAVGYVGPLDQELLTFACIVSAVRTSLRDLVEAVLVSMFLNGEAERERKDWTDLSTSLPFIEDNGSALGVAVKTYLDALDTEGDSSAALKTQIKSQDDKYGWFAQVQDGTLDTSLELAWNLWDAINAGVQKSGEREARSCAEVDQWLSSRR